MVKQRLAELQLKKVELSVKLILAELGIVIGRAFGKAKIARASTRTFGKLKIGRVSHRNW